MKKTLITLAALAMASVASAVTTHDAIANLSGEALSDGALSPTATDFTITVILDWEKVASGLGSWSDRANVVLGTHNATDWWTTGFNMFPGGGNYTGQVALTMLLDNQGQSLTAATDTNATDGVTVHGGTIGEGYFMVDDSHDRLGKLALTFTYVADSDANTAGNQSVGTLYALKSDGSLSAVYATQNNEWNLAGYPFNIVGINNKGAIEQVLVFDSALSAADVASISKANVPEPTTATLSLLALAGLAARRRRK